MAALAKLNGYFDTTFFIKGVGILLLVFAAIFSYGFFENKNVQSSYQDDLDITLVSIQGAAGEDQHQSPKAHHSDDTAHSNNSSTHETAPSVEVNFYNRDGGKWIPLRPDAETTVFSRYQQSNAYPETSDQKLPQISIIFIDSGLEQANVFETAINDLPPVFSFAYYPYLGNQNEERAKAAYVRGFENWSMFLAQPDSFPLNDRGELALTQTDSPQLMEEKSLKMIENIPYTIGYIGYPQTGFLESDQAQKFMESYLNQYGLGYIHGENDISVQKSISGSAPFSQMDIVIDSQASSQFINAGLSALEATAFEAGYAVGYAHLYPETIKVLKEWIPTLTSKSVQLVSTSQLMRGKFLDSYAPIASLTSNEESASTHEESEGAPHVVDTIHAEPPHEPDHGHH